MWNKYPKLKRIKTLSRFRVKCQEGVNKGKPGVCPGPQKEEPKQDKIMERFIANAKQFDIRESNKLEDSIIDEMSNDWETMSQQITFKQETLEDITEQIQNECHSFIESVPNVNYQDATNTFLFMKLAELTLKLKNI